MKAHELSVYQCDIHANRTIKYICMDPNCTESAQTCELCVVKLHTKCRDEFLVSRNDLPSKLSITNTKHYDDSVESYFSKLFDERIACFNVELRAAKKKILESFINQMYALSTKSDLYTLNKAEVDINFNPETNKIEIKSRKQQIVQSNIDNNIEAAFNSQKEKFAKMLNSINLHSTPELDLDNWLVSLNSELVLKKKCYSLSLNGDSGPDNEGGCILKTPLKPCVVKFTFYSDTYDIAKIRIGLIDAEGLESSIKNRKVTAFKQPTISYCTSFNVIESKTSENCLEKTFKHGNEIVMIVKRGKVHFRSVQYSSCFSGSLTPDAEYFLFVGILEVGNRCEISFIE